MQDQTENSEHEWLDLSTNRAGEGARSQAETELAGLQERHSKFRIALARIFNTHNDERAWRVGAVGEEVIGARLNKLEDNGWKVIHSIPIGSRGSDIDHLLIGPSGVWTLNTKNHPEKKIWVSPKQIRVNGKVVPYLRKSEFEADRVRKILTEKLGWEPFVKAAIVFMTGTVIPDVTIKGMPENVLILDRMDIPRIFKRGQSRLSEDQISEIFAIARKSTTWN